MTTAFINRRPVLAYYLLAFAISWLGILVVVGGPGGIPVTGDFLPLLPAVLTAMLAGPVLAGLLLTGLVYGKAGYGELASRLFRWRVGACWYAVALLTPPLVMGALPLVLSLAFPVFLPGILATPDAASLLALGLVGGLAAGVFEELGWTGFAIPRIRQGCSVLKTGLIVGFLWGAWHLVVNIWSSGGPSGELRPDLLLLSLAFSWGILPAYRVLMVWVYDRTRSLFLAMLMHASLTSGNIIFVPPDVEGATGLMWSLIVAAALWIIVAAVVRLRGGEFR